MVVELTVEKLSPKGMALIEHKNKAYLAKGLWPGDKVLVRLKSNGKKFGEAELIELVEPSKERRDVPCPHWGVHEAQCTSCPWMHATYEAQVAQKERQFKYLVRRNNLRVKGQENFLSSPLEWGYRKRIQVKTDGYETGFLDNQTQVLVPISKCSILSTKLKSVLKTFNKNLPNEEWEPRADYQFSFIDLDESMENLPLSDFKVNFKQPYSDSNTYGLDLIQQWLEPLLKQMDTPKALELFCGEGHITELLIQSGVQEIISVDFQSEAIKRLDEKKLQGVTTLKKNLFQRKTFEMAPLNDEVFPLIMVHPPKQGLQFPRNYKKLLSGCEHFIYLSSSTESFFKDVRFLLREGLELVKLTGLDTAPHTPHFDLMAYFKKAEKKAPQKKDSAEK